MEKIKLIIAGSRDLTDIQQVYNALNKSKINKVRVSEIVSGGAHGVDKLGEEIAQKYNIPIKLFPANWDKYGKSAGYRRNAEMANYADALIAIWLDASKGTGHMVDLMKKKNKYVFAECIKTYFYCHHESDCIWTSYDPNEATGLVEEIDKNIFDNLDADGYNVSSFV